jgi:tetratricopeptide (TPR) repeat protein
MKHLWALVLAVGAVAAEAPPASACLWDYDTLKEEALRDADVGKIVKGQLEKHSPAFYEAKVTYTRALVDKGDAKKERYDDLAVALAKTGKVDDALAVLEDKEAKFPGEYTTLANRGTFLAMKGDAKGALAALKKAVEINPDAHFGRERVQIALLEYMQRLSDPDLPKNENFLGLSMVHADVLIEGSFRDGNPKKRDKDLDQSIKGLVGLIRFGDAQENKHVWFALGWALAAQGDGQLAARAFRRAENLGHPRAGDDGSIVVTTLRKLDLDQPCCPDPGSEEALRAWRKATPTFDTEAEKAAAAETKRQAREDKKIAKKQWKQLFGY